MGNPTPSQGCIVLALVDPDYNNGEPTAPAMITHVHHVDDGKRGFHVVNYRIFYDTEESPRLVTSAALYGDKESARNDGIFSAHAAAYWPPRA